MVDLIRLPRRERAPIVAVLRRIGFAVALVLFIACVVRLGRDGYVDVTGDEITFADAVYYASVTVTTTGYGDITAVSDGTRLATTLLITPVRILFLILVVGTTVEVLTEQSRALLLTRRWRQRVKDHYLICGFGATGASAASDLIRRGVHPDHITAVDIDPEAIAEAGAMGLTAVQGDATRRAVLEQAAIDRAQAVIIATNRDDTAVLVVLTARELNPGAHIVASGREQENLHLLRNGGADEVIDTTATVGQMLGLGTYAPGAVGVLGDILYAGAGLEVIEIDPHLVGDRPSVPPEVILVAIIRDGHRVPLADVDLSRIRADDRLVVLQEGSPSDQPAAR